MEVKSAWLTVILQPIGAIKEDLLNFLCIGIELKIPGSSSLIAERAIEVPSWAFNSRRGQYLSSAILKALANFHGPRPLNMKVLGVADVDAYVPGLNFVFGEAQMGGSYAIIYLARLKLDPYGGRVDEGLFMERALKEAVHELGHTLGLGHCPDPACVMKFSNSIVDTDHKTSELCDYCKARLLTLFEVMVGAWT